MNKIFELLKDPFVIALLVGIPVFLRALSELLRLIGKIIPGEDFAESSSNKIKKLAGYIVTILGWLGLGNQKK